MHAQRGAVAAKRLEDVVGEPRRVAQLDRPPPRRRGRGQELVEAGDVDLPVRRELDEVGPERGAERREPFDVAGQPRPGVRELLAVAAELPELDGEEEPGWRLGRPALDRAGAGQPVERAVQLDGVEQLGVAREPLPGRQALRVDDAPPVVVRPARAPDAQRSGGHGRRSRWWSTATNLPGGGRRQTSPRPAVDGPVCQTAAVTTTTILCTDGSELANLALAAGLPLLAPADRTMLVTVVEPLDASLVTGVSGFGTGVISPGAVRPGRRGPPAGGGAGRRGGVAHRRRARRRGRRHRG